TYWEKFQNRFYVAGDSAHRDKEGYFWIMGRIDDVLNVAGHRLGTMEIESALVAHARVAEAAVVGKPHEIKGEAVFAYVICRGSKPSIDESARLTEELRAWVGEQLGAIAKPDEIRFTEVLPKTRSGKIMRRLLRAVARGEEVTQDVSTLENPAILDQLRGIETDGRSAPRSGSARAKSARKTAGRRASKRRAPSKRRVKSARAAGRATGRARKPARSAARQSKKSAGSTARRTRPSARRASSVAR